MNGNTAAGVRRWDRFIFFYFPLWPRYTLTFGLDIILLPAGSRRLVLLQYSKIFDFPEHFLLYSLLTRLSRSILTAKALSNTLFFRQQLELPQYFNEIFPTFQTHSHSCTREVMQKIISAIDEKKNSEHIFVKLLFSGVW